MLNILEDHPVIASWLAIVAPTYALFRYAEFRIDDEIRSSLTKRLGSLRAINAGSVLSHQFERIFDSVFGARHLSARCAFQSCLASLFSVTVIYAIYVIVRPEETEFLWTTKPNLEHAWFLGQGFIMLIGATSVLNFAPDYVSLLQTRWVIKRIASGSRATSMLILDFLATFAVAFFSLAIIIGLLSLGFSLSLFDDNLVRAEFSLHVIRKLFTENVLPLKGLVLTKEANWTESDGSSVHQISTTVYPSLGLFFYSTFFTSIWLWLYFISSILTRSAFKPIVRVWNIEKHPVELIGIVSCAVITCLFVAYNAVKNFP